MVRNVLGMMQAGQSRAEVLAAYPSLTGDDIDAAFAYAIELVNEVGLVTSAA